MNNDKQLKFRLFGPINRLFKGELQVFFPFLFSSSSTPALWLEVLVSKERKTNENNIGSRKGKEKNKEKEQKKIEEKRREKYSNKMTDGNLLVLRCGCVGCKISKKRRKFYKNEMNERFSNETRCRNKTRRATLGRHLFTIYLLNSYIFARWSHQTHTRSKVI